MHTPRSILTIGTILMVTVGFMAPAPASAFSTFVPPLIVGTTGGICVGALKIMNNYIEAIHNKKTYKRTFQYHGAILGTHAIAGFISALAWGSCYAALNDGYGPGKTPWHNAIWSSFVGAYCLTLPIPSFP